MGTVLNYHAVVRWTIGFLLAMTAIAQADHAATFAKAFGTSRDVAEYTLPPGNEMTHVVTGRFESGTYTMTGALLMTCTESCEWRRADFGAADAIEVHGVVDLHGAAGPLPARALPPGPIKGARAMKFPALVIRTREGKRVKLYLVSLVDADRGAVVLMDTAEEPGRRGFVRTYRLDKPDPKAPPLDIVAKERCTEVIYGLEERHYRTKKVTPGC
jgi:hypothetical protein